MLLLCDERVPCDQCAVSEWVSVCVYIIVMGSVIYMFINSIMTSQKKKRKKLNYVDKMFENWKGKESEKEKDIQI